MDSIPSEEQLVENATRRLSTQPEPKTLLSIRIDTDVLGGFRSSGPGYQVRINQALRDFAVQQGWISHELANLIRPRGRPRKNTT